MKKKILALCLVVVLAITAVTGATLAYFTDTQKVTNVFTAGNVDITLTEPKWDPQATHNIMPGASFDKDPTITVAKGSEECYVFLDVTLNKYKSLGPTMAKYAVAKGYITEDLFNTFCVTEGEGENSKTVFQTANFLGYFMQYDMETLRTILDDWFVDIEHKNWKIVDYGYNCDRNDIDAENGNWLTIRLAYIGNGDATLSAEENVVFMTAFTMPSDVTEEMLDHNLTENMFYEGNDFEIDFTAYAIQAQELADVDAAYEAYFAQN